jgi:hypothetical protein
MAHVGITTQLDAQLFGQALAVLERERPSPREDLLFRLLNLLVWSAVALTGLYLALVLTRTVSQDAGRPIARAAAALYLLIVPVFLLNWKTMNKLRRAAALRRRLDASWKRVLNARVSARYGTLSFGNLTTLLLSLVGYVVSAGGVLGLLAEVTGGRSQSRLALAVTMVVFGLSCIFIRFMSRGRERFQAVADLRASLLGGRDASDGTELSADDYDEIVKIERAQIWEDRRRSLAALAKAPEPGRYRSRESRAVRESKAALPEAVAMRVQACIDGLISDLQPESANTRAVTEPSVVSVPGTPLELTFTVDHAAREVKLFELREADGRRTAAATSRSPNKASNPNGELDTQD